MSEHKKYLYGFTKLDLITPARFRKLEQQFQNNLHAAWEYISDWDLALNLKQISQLKFQQSKIDLEKEYAELQQEEIQIISAHDELFPYQLKQCPSPPFALFYKGHLPEQQRLLTVVGSRKMTQYGKHCLENFLPPILENNIGIASGLAYGVDKYAHELALKHDAYTLAVLPSGLDKITPRNHYSLAQQILKHSGCLLSEIPPGAKITKGAFPRRNRLLAALGEATVVVEAARKSGSKITAYQAINTGKDVGAIPGSVFSMQSQGCHDLIKDGATPICSEEDLLMMLDIQLLLFKQKRNRSNKEEIIYQLLVHHSPEEVLEKSPFSFAETMRIITKLELEP